MMHLKELIKKLSEIYVIHGDVPVGFSYDDGILIEFLSVGVYENIKDGPYYRKPKIYKKICVIGDEDLVDHV